MREQILARQKQMGIVPPDTDLAENPEYIPRWDTLSEDEKTVFTRQMEVYATLVESADHEVGRLVDAIEEIGELDNTLIFYIAGDNGGSSIGDINGVFVEWVRAQRRSRGHPVPAEPARRVRRPDLLPELLGRLGGGRRRPRRPGASRWPTAAATWPARSCTGPRASRPRARSAASTASVIDIVPTILEAVGMPEPKVVKGAEQTPMAGVSMAYSFDDGDAPERHTTQYNEVSGNRSIYHDGWLAAVVHRAPWEPAPRVGELRQDRWELYHMAEDFGLAHDLADQYPEKLEEMKALFHAEAIKYGVYPLDDRAFERLNPVVGRPTRPDGRADRAHPLLRA